MDEEAASGEKTEPKRGRAFLFLIFVLVGALCFEAGLLAQVWPAEKSIEIKLAEVSASPKAPPEAVDTGKVASSSQIAEETSTATCPFVGSKNSDKYHIPTCSYAKRILPENRVCFSSEEEAKARGYSAGCLK